MRLSQIARKLGVAPSTVSELLVKKGYDTPKNGNAKLNEEQIAELYKHYDIVVFTEPEVIKELEAEAEKEANMEEAVIEEKEIEIAAPSLEMIKEEEVENINEPEESLAVEEVTEEEPIEVIRAKKVKLEGIKVLGKIDLPEPKVKKEVEETEDSEKEEVTTKKRPQRTPRNKRDQRRKKPELTFEQKQAAADRKREREKREREKKIKEKKQAYFRENIKPKQTESALAAKKRKKKKEQAKQSSPQRTKITTKNPFKRFWQWLNDPYA